MSESEKSGATDPSFIIVDSVSAIFLEFQVEQFEVVDKRFYYSTNSSVELSQFNTTSDAVKHFYLFLIWC